MPPCELPSYPCSRGSSLNRASAAGNLPDTHADFDGILLSRMADVVVFPDVREHAQPWREPWRKLRLGQAAPDSRRARDRGKRCGGSEAYRVRIRDRSR